MQTLYKSQLSQLGQIGGLFVGAVFGGLLAAAVTVGLRWASLYNLFTDPIVENIVILIVAVGLVVGMWVAFSSSNRITLRFKIALTIDYLNAREIIQKRRTKG